MSYLTPSPPCHLQLAKGRKRSLHRLLWKPLKATLALILKGEFTGGHIYPPDVLLPLLELAKDQQAQRIVTFRLSGRALKLLKLLGLRLGVGTACAAVRLALLHMIRQRLPDFLPHIPEHYHQPPRCPGTLRSKVAPALSRCPEGAAVKQTLVSAQLFIATRYLAVLDNVSVSEVCRESLRQLLEEVGWGNCKGEFLTTHH